MSLVPDDLLAARERLNQSDAVGFVTGARRPSGGRRAAVLVLLGDVDGEREVVLVEKRPDLRHHAGQVAFPGGGVEPADVDAVAAALREAEEEVGVDPTTVTALGALPAAHVPSGFDVTSVVGWWTRPSALQVVDAGEIAAVHQVPVARLLDPANRDTWRHPAGFTGPGFRLGELYVWGFTAFVLDGLFDLLGWTIEWPRERIAEIPARFLSDRL